MSPTVPGPADLVRRIPAHATPLRIIPTEGARRRSHSCAQIRHDLELGRDPVAHWRALVATSTRARYAGQLPAAMPGAFVAQWYCEVVATPGAFSAVMTEFVPDISPECLSFDVDPVAGYPTTVGLAAGETTLEPDPQRRLELTRERYLAHVGPFVAAYEAGVKAGTRQRAGMARDVWARAVEAALAARDGRAPVPVARESCCFIYALPGTHACAGCPRLG